MMKSRSVLLALGAALVMACAAAAEDAPRTIVLDPTQAAGEPTWQLLADKAGGPVVQVAIGAVDVRGVEMDGTAFSEVTIAGGELQGAPGRPALPVISRLVAVPEGMTVRVRNVAQRTTTLDGAWLPLPAQDLQAANAPLLWDRAWYSDKAAADAVPAAEVGAPARLHGVRVVPLTLHPVAWDRTDGTLKAATSLEIDLEYVPSAEAPARTPADRPLPASFATLLEQTVLGFDKSSVTIVPLGTWACIMPGDLAVQAAVQPLLEWRARQGYNVVVASTTDIGTSNTAIKAWLQDQYDTLKTPLEMVCLVGDADGSVAVASWRESLSGYSGEGDHPYTQLDGPDVLADVHIGRLTATSASELGIVVNKIVGYESNPWLTNDTEWFLRAGLTGDPSSSGYSTIWVNQWVKEQLQQMNYARIDTIWSGNFVTQMMATVSAGESIFTYRGYWNMSGLNTGYIAAMSNQQKLPYAVIMTCDTGSFWTDQTARSEAFLRAPSGGGVAAIGTATIGTHTRYNNCMFQGTLENVLNSGDNRVGPSLTRGKLNIYANYFAPEPERVTIWSTWNNLMGDPATSIWTAVPRALTVDAPAALDGNATAVPVVVTADGQPVEGAIVAAYRKNTYTGNAVTGADGRVVLPIDGLADGVLYLTVTGRNLQPWQGEITIGTVALSLDRVAVVVDDDMNGGSSGDGDGIAEPGETVELWVTVGNGGTDPAVDVTATLASPDADAVVVQDAVTYGAIAAGGSAPGGTSFVVSLAPALAGGRELSLELTASDQGQAFTGLVTLAIAGPAASVAGAVPGTGVLNPGETGALAITLANGGDRDLAGATALLSSNDPWVTVLDGSGAWGAIPVGGSAANGADGFSVSVGSDCVPGHLAVLQLDVTYASGGTASLPVAVTFGAATPTDPTGPDAYGYYAFDDTDAAWTQAPVYDWVEIDPAAGGSGTFLGLTDYAIYSDDTRTVDLPFAFRYYGQDFAKISICSNGWFSFGTTYQRHYRNRTLPAPGTPDNLVAVYWDEVYQVSGDGGVFTWYDAANHRYVIEWRRMRNEVSAALETFQAVLYDPAYGAGDTGDGMILMQYQTVNAVDSTEGYATVGIQDEALGDAVLYTYWNAYTPGSTPIAAGRAILFTTFEAQVQGQLLGTVTNASAGGAPLPGAVVSVVGAGRSLMTAANGAYAGGVPVGTWAIAAQCQGFAPDTVWNVAVAEALPTQVDFALVDVLGPSFATANLPGATTDTAGPYTVTTTATDASGVAEVRAYYTSSASGGPFELPLAPTGQPGEYAGDIPGQPLGTRVQFWFTGRDVAGNASVEPAGGPFSPYAFAVIEPVAIASSDMESDDGWTSGQAGDTATTGQWVRIDPNAVINNSVYVQPEDDHTPTGTLCWITGDDPVGSAQGVADVDGGRTTLLSPVYDVSGVTSLELRYWRWYTNDTGNNPGADIWTVQAAFDGGTWFDLENTLASDRSWSEHVFALENLAPGLGDQLQLRFIAEDAGAGSVVEAGVDDVTLVGYPIAADTTAPSAAMVAPDGGEVIQGGTEYQVTWTHGDDVGVVEARIFLQTTTDGPWTELGRGPYNQAFTWQLDPVVGLPLGSQGGRDKALDQCRIRVEVYDAVGHVTTVESAAPFTISSGQSPVPGAEPLRLALDQNRPNPFNPSTEIRFSLAKQGDVTVTVYDVNGRLVRTLVAGVLPAGPHAVTWKGDDDRGARAASGLYFCRLQAQGGTLVRKMTLLK